MRELNTSAAAPIALLSLGNLVIGTGAFVLAGILGAVSADLGIGIAAAGQGVTAYALSTAIFAPLLLVAVGTMDRRRALALGLLLFAAGNLICAAASGLPMLLAGRVVMGAGAMYTPIAAGLALAGTPPAQHGRALSLVFLGMSLSYVVGLPLGNWATVHYGWRVPVQGVAVAALLMLALLWWRVPASGAAAALRFNGVLALLARPGVARALFITWLYFTAIFTTFSYIGPVLRALGAQTDADVSLALLVVGLSGVAGTLLGGWASDRFGALRTLRLQTAVFGSAQLLLPLTAPVFGAALAVFVIWCLAGFGMMAPQQSRLAAAAPQQAPLLLSLNSSMLYLGTAAGAVVGGLAAQQLALSQLSWSGVPFVITALLLLVTTRR